MAKVTAHFAADYLNPAFYNVIAGAYSFTVTTNFSSPNGYTYPDALVVLWRSGTEDYKSIFGGSGFEYNDLNGRKNITFGNATGYLEFYSYANNYVPVLEIEEISVPAATLFLAFTTPSMADDLQISQQYASGGDIGNGSPYNDVLGGYGGDDSIQGNGGNDTLDGGEGIDTAVFTGIKIQYDILVNGASITVSDKVPGRDGRDTLSNFEFLRFKDQNISTNLLSTYTLVASSASVNEGSTATFTLSTTNVSAGTQVAYTLSGISAADIQGGALTGTAIVGANGQATISVALLADTLTEGAETLTMTAGGKTASTIVNDTSTGSSTVQPGTSGSDIFRITSGSNNIDGGAGSDIVQYQTTRSAASVTLNNGTITVSKANGTDTITGVERIDFTDGDLVFDVTSANAPAAYRLYGGAFARTPDEGGFRFWTSTLDTNVSLHDVASQFINSGEFIGRYGASLGNAAFVDALYQNVLGRGGDAGGVAHWNRMLDNKYQDRSDILVQFTQLPEFVGISAGNTTNGYWVV
jgi:hypothetical protein